MWSMIGECTGKPALDADLEAHLADLEGLAEAVTLAADDDALEHLDTRARAFDDVDVHLDGVAGTEVRDVGTQRCCVDVVEELAHDWVTLCGRARSPRIEFGKWWCVPGVGDSPWQSPARARLPILPQRSSDAKHVGDETREDGPHDRTAHPRELDGLRVAGRFVADVLDELLDTVDVGVNLLDLDRVAARMIAERGAVSCYVDYHPSFGRSPFGKNLCTSVNDAALHGLPYDRVLSTATS